MSSIGRRVLGLCAGLLVGVVVIGAIEAVGHAAFPPPAGTDLADRQARAELIASAPAGLSLVTAAAWLVGSLAAALLARTIEGPGRAVATTIAGTLLVLAGVSNVVALPYPAWFRVLGPAALAAGSLAGGRLAGLGLARRSKAGTSPR